MREGGSLIRGGFGCPKYPQGGGGVELRGKERSLERSPYGEIAGGYFFGKVVGVRGKGG